MYPILAMVHDRNTPSYNSTTVSKPSSVRIRSATRRGRVSRRRRTLGGCPCEAGAGLCVNVGMCHERQSSFAAAMRWYLEDHSWSFHQIVSGGIRGEWPLVCPHFVVITYVQKAFNWGDPGSRTTFQTWDEWFQGVSITGWIFTYIEI